MSAKSFMSIGDAVARAMAVMPGGSNSGARIAGTERLVIASTSGATITDLSGKRYVDYHAGFGPFILGHNDPDVDQAAWRMGSNLDLPGIGVTPVEIELAEKIVANVPSVERVLLTCSGSEATYHAIRLARAATGRRRIIKFQGCYHGWHDAVLMNVISPPDRVGTKDPHSLGMFSELVDATIVLSFNDLDAVGQALEENKGEVAAIILEPIQHNVGAVLPKPGYLAGLRALCDKHGTVLIFDEVITGFRHHLGGYQAIAGVKPDLTTMGKALGNGYPIGAIGGRADLMDMFVGPRTGGVVYFGGTYNGHAIPAAAALATIEKLEREPVHEHIFSLGDRIRRELQDLFDSLGVQAFVTGFGSVWVTYFLEPPVESYTDLLRNDAELFVEYRLELLKHGIFEWPVNLKRCCVSYAHNQRHVDELLTAAEQAVTAVVKRRMADKGWH
jgi:glutamate-1-semialdehyde 2,1-aminomutase